jgi:hypothetical protein
VSKRSNSLKRRAAFTEIINLWFAMACSFGNTPGKNADKSAAARLHLRVSLAECPQGGSEGPPESQSTAQEVGFRRNAAPPTPETEEV